MRILNYLNLNQYPIQLSFIENRTNKFDEIYHAHQGMELLYVHSGGGHVITNGVLTEIKPGSLFCFRPFQVHRVKLDIKKDPYIRSLFVFEPSVLIKYIEPFKGLQIFFNNLWKMPMVQTIFADISEEKLRYLIDDLEKEISSASANERMDSEAYFLTSVIHLLMLQSSKNDQKLSHRPAIKQTDSIPLILDWLENHFHEDFKLEELAKAVHLSPNYVSYIFHKVSGSSITDYLAARRIQEACYLLRTTSLSIQEVGYRVGFSSFSYFCKFFKMNICMTPLHFRQSQT